MRAAIIKIRQALCYVLSLTDCQAVRELARKGILAADVLLGGPIQ
jgi:hypothetical protein